MQDEWTRVISGDRLVKFTYVDLPSGTAFMTAQIAAHEVVYSIILEQTEWAFSRVGVEGRFGYELRPSPNGDTTRARGTVRLCSWWRSSGPVHRPAEEHRQTHNVDAY